MPVFSDDLSQNIDQLFDDPWYSGTSASSTAVPSPYQVALAGHPYIIDPKQYQRATVPLQRQSTDESVEPGEQTLNTGGAWRRSQDNWFLGAGQLYLDNRFAFVSVYTHSGEDPSVRTRFWNSKGVNPWNEGELSLLPEQGTIKTGSGSGQLVCVVGGYAYYWDGTTLYESVDPLSASPTWTAVTCPKSGTSSWSGITITGLATDGFNLYVACGPYGLMVVPNGSGVASYLRPPAPASLLGVVSGTPGSTTYNYQVIAQDAQGFMSLASGVEAVTNGPTTLSGGDSIILTWDAVPGTTNYLLVRGGGLLTSTTLTTYTDDGSASPGSFTLPTADTDNFQATSVGYGNGFILAGAANLLCSVAANGITTLVVEHINPGFTWDCYGGGDVALYVAGHSGNVSELYGIQLSSSSFALTAPYIAGQVGNGEVITGIQYYQGVCVLTTTLGIRTAQDTNANGHLTTGAVITQLGGSNCCVSFGPFVYWGIEDFTEDDGIYDGSAVTCGLARLYLSEFSDALVPAYASDLQTPNGITGRVGSVAIFGSTPLFTVDGEGLYGPTGNVVEYGYLEAGYVRYGTVENKILVSGDLRHTALLDGQSVQLDTVPFEGLSFQVLNSNQIGSIGPTGPVSAGDSVGESFHMILTLNRGTDETQGPTLARWTVRAMIVSVRQDEIMLPILWADTVQNPIGDGQTLEMDLPAEWDFLKGLESSGIAFIYQEGQMAYIAYIDQVIVQQPTGWNSDLGMLEGVLMVKLLTVN